MLSYLTQADGIVKCLGPSIEVHRLLDFILALILAGQVIRCCPVSCFIRYFSSLKRKPKSSHHAQIKYKNTDSHGSRGSRLPYLLDVALKAVNTDQGEIILS